MKKSICNIPRCPFEGGYCRVHRTDEVKPTHKVTTMSDKRKELQKEYLKLRKEFLRLHPICAEAECKQPAVDIHHSAGKTGDMLIDVDFFIPLCRKHHQYYEVRPIEAKEKGISKSRLTKSKKSYQG